MAQVPREKRAFVSGAYDPKRDADEQAMRQPKRIENITISPRTRFRRQNYNRKPTPHQLLVQKRMFPDN